MKEPPDSAAVRQNDRYRYGVADAWAARQRTEPADENGNHFIGLSGRVGTWTMEAKGLDLKIIWLTLTYPLKREGISAAGRAAVWALAR